MYKRQTLGNSFGDLDKRSNFTQALFSAAKNAAEDNIPDYTSELLGLTKDSFLEELDELNIALIYKNLVQNSIGSVSYTHLDVYKRQEYGGVFVKESRAPEGFQLDENAYYIEITENEKIYDVENEAGKGFVNAAQTGSLRIEKTSSDGKLEGFTFRITGANGYDKTFITDEQGEIHVELRVGCLLYTSRCV